MLNRQHGRSRLTACAVGAVVAALVVGVAAFCLTDAVVVWPLFPLMVDLESSPHFAVALLQLTLTWPVPPIAVYSVFLIFRGTRAQSRIVLPAIAAYTFARCMVYAVQFHVLIGVGVGRLAALELSRLLPASIVTGFAFLWAYNRLVRATHRLTSRSATRGAEPS